MFRGLGFRVLDIWSLMVGISGISRVDGGSGSGFAEGILLGASFESSL